MQKLIRELREYDRQLVLHQDRRGAWVLYRRPERYGEAPDRLADYEIRWHLINGALAFVMWLEGPDGQPRDPGFWVLDELKRRDSRVRNLKREVWEMDEYNRQLSEKASEDTSDRVRYRVKEDFNHIVDELRGDTIFRKTTQSVDIDL